ncbi:putative mitochondrial chaperone BCS1-B [Colletotrichum tropicale]|nr:putative mitochondrial chaperone BCS1-B [Colletotrichum tropicale]
MEEIPWSFDTEGNCFPDPRTFRDMDSQPSGMDSFFPGYSIAVELFRRHLGLDLSSYVPFILILGMTGFAWAYVGEHVRSIMKTCFMSTAEIRPDDEIYNVIMSWVAGQPFGSNSRHFIVNMDLNSTVWSPWAWRDDLEDSGLSARNDKFQPKPLAYTPSFGAHLFWYKGRPIFFRRDKDNQQPNSLSNMKREEISLWCFGYSPAILKDLLDEAHKEYLRMDDNKTMIYRANLQPRSEPTWQRCMARDPRHFSTIVTRPGLKESIIDDITDYLSPETRMWYTDCGIPWRRGYLFAGPPGTGKSSFSFALAGHFKLRIYTVSLSSSNASEENLASLFTQLPQVCIVLFEDIDAAGLTSTRDPAAEKSGRKSSGKGKLSLSGLLNLLDGVASQEGRILIMSTNHVENLDKALIRPGRVDMTVHFTSADTQITAAIFRTVFASLDKTAKEDRLIHGGRNPREASARIQELSEQFAAKIPSGEFSPAEVQGYLIKHKRQPEVAVSCAEEWAHAMRLEKAASKTTAVVTDEGGEESSAQNTGEGSSDEESDA